MAEDKKKPEELQNEQLDEVNGGVDTGDIRPTHLSDKKCII